MDKVRVELEHCYGIKKFEQEFDFSECRAFAIYAPNGAMKSSLAQTFKDVAEGRDSRDRIFPDRKTKRIIVDESGAELAADSIVVVLPYDEEVGQTEKTSVLLVNSDLRREYEALHEEIETAKTTFLAAMKTQSKSKRDLSAEISSAFMKSDAEFYPALVRVKDEVARQSGSPFGDVEYDRIFDDKILQFLRTEDVRTAIESYIEKYNQLLEASTYFTKGTFSYYNGATIAKSLASNGFFEADHTIRLNADVPTEISTREELETLIADEKAALLNDQQLRARFDKVEKLIQKNAGLREFEQYVSAHEDILPELENIGRFKEQVWKSYFKESSERYEDVVQKYVKATDRREAIERQAAEESTQWEAVIHQFNERFSVPFTLEAENRVPMILGQEPMLSLKFTYDDGEDQAPIGKNELMQVLSTGEKKALYILNVIFEVEARKSTNQETLFIVDDLADSFDYKNKYAIIQYLQEISEQPYFRLVLLTHNFDFLRTVERGFIPYSHCLMTEKDKSGIKLRGASGIRNVFVNAWKEAFFDDAKMRIACIPFMRNLIEMMTGKGDRDYATLTSLLHWKAESATITHARLDEIYIQLFRTTGSWRHGNMSVATTIFDEVKECLTVSGETNLENKVVLSIAIRLAAEQFMVDQIRDAAFVGSITSNQTATLLKKYAECPDCSDQAIETIRRVILMTPENIHLNAFMYEPIVDMSDEHLRKLYSDVLQMGKRRCQEEKVSA